MNPPPAFDMTVLSSNPNQFTISKYAGLIAIGSTIISAYTITTVVIISEYLRKRKPTSPENP